MSRLEEIRNEYAFSNQYPTWDEFISDLPIYQREEHYNNTTIEYAREVAIASLEKASENAATIFTNHEQTRSKVHKPSIIHESNIVML